MSDQMKALYTKKAIITDLVITGVWFAFFCYILPNFVPSDDPTARAFFGVFGATCMTGVFYMAINMFRVVRADFVLQQKAAKKS